MVPGIYKVTAAVPASEPALAMVDLAQSENESEPDPELEPARDPYPGLVQVIGNSAIIAVPINRGGSAINCSCFPVHEDANQEQDYASTSNWVSLVAHQYAARDNEALMCCVCRGTAPNKRIFPLHVCGHHICVNCLIRLNPDQGCPICRADCTLAKQ